MARYGFGPLMEEEEGDIAAEMEQQEQQEEEEKKTFLAPVVHVERKVKAAPQHEAPKAASAQPLKKSPSRHDRTPSEGSATEAMCFASAPAHLRRVPRSVSLRNTNSGLAFRRDRESRLRVFL